MPFRSIQMSRSTRAAAVPLLRLLLCVLAGHVLTVLIAWCCILSPKYQYDGLYRVPYMTHRGAREYGYFEANRAFGAVFLIHKGERVDEVVPRDVFDSAHVHDSADVWSWSRMFRAYDEPYDAPSGMRYVFCEEGAGWPALALHWWGNDDEGCWNGLEIGRRPREIYYFDFGRKMIELSTVAKGGGVLPVQPIWSGIMIDIALYSAACYAGLAAWGMLRRRWAAPVRAGSPNSCGAPVTAGAAEAVSGRIAMGR